MDDDWEAFWLAIKDVVEARQTMAAGVINDDGADQPLQRPLGNGEAPTLESFVAVLNSVGLAIDVKLA
jgi:DNA-binding phage protein